MLDLALDSKIFINTPIDAALQELDILFNTEKTELINNPFFGTNFEQFLWNLNPSAEQLRQYIFEQITNTYFVSQMECEVKVDILNGEIRDLYYVQIVLHDNDGSTGYREYEFR